MDVLERAIAFLSPRRALQRAVDRRRLDLYQVGEMRDYRHRARDIGGGNTINQAYGEKLVNFARHLQRNDPTVHAAIREMAIRSSHFELQPMVRLKDGTPAAELNDALSEKWERFRDSIDSMGVMSYSQWRQAVGESFVRDGEVYLQHLISSRRYPYPTSIPVAFYAMESDYLPYHMSGDEPRIVQGVQLGVGNRVTHYHVYRRHPSEYNVPGLPFSEETLSIRAERISALRRIERIGQVRGVSLIASSAAAATDMHEYMDAERISMKFAAAVGIQITRPDRGEPVLEDAEGYQTIDFGPGFVLDNLGPGEKAEMMHVDRPGNQFANYIKVSNRIIAAGIGANYSAMTNDFDGSYSSQRQMLVTAEAYYQQLQRQQVSAIERPIWERFLQGLVIAGEMPANLRQVDPETMRDCLFVGPAMPWIDPQKEAAAFQTEVANKFQSRAGVIRQRGRNIRQIDQEIEADEQATNVERNDRGDRESQADKGNR